MATIPTSIGPIGARQINRNFFVGQSDLGTIQKAVTIAAASGGGCVIIPAGYMGSDAIASVTGGNATVYISDQRNSAWQGWRWSGAAFAPADFDQLSGFIARGVTQPAAATMQMFFDPAGTSGISGNTGTGYLLSTANAGTGVPSFQLQSQRSDGGQRYTFMRCDLDNIGDFRIQMPQVLELNNDAANLNLWAGQSRDTDNSQGFYIWGRPDLNLIDLQSETVNHPFHPIIAINRLGGDVEIAPLGTTTAGDINAGNITASDISASDAAFATCEVANSPVRTFANTGDAPAGMVWPPIGIAVSAGSTWGTSISPASLATYPPAGIPQSTGTAWGASIAAATLATWPPAGIAVSTGTAWGAAIAAANVAMLNQANNFAQMNSFTLNASGGITIGSGGGLTVAWNVGNGTGETDFINNHAAVGGGFYWFNVAPGAAITAATVPGMKLDSNNALTVMGTVYPNIGISVKGASLTTTGVSNLGFASDIATLDSWGAAGSRGTMRLRIGSAGAANLINALIIDASGNATIFGTLTASGKSFRIPHPLDDSKDLMHSCLEGPEWGVYYRGESATKGGWVEITLPDYFEALTTPENRTVLLTVLFDDEAEPISALAASRVKAGKFKVWSGLPTQKFFWEVKAVRADIEPLNISPQRIVMQPPPGEETHEEA